MVRGVLHLGDHGARDGAAGGEDVVPVEGGGGVHRRVLHYCYWVEVFSFTVYMLGKQIRAVG